MFKRFLHEAINVPGAQHIGTAKGYDLFDITTFEAAQQFVNASSNALAGTDWVQNASTFNSNIGEHLHLYFFVLENTNRVKYGVIKGRGTDDQSLVINTTKNTNITLNVNFSLENTTHDLNVAGGDPVPLFLLPDIDIEEAVGRDGCYFSDDMFVGVLPQFCEQDTVEITELPPHIKFIDDHAFFFGQDISILVLSDNIESLGSNVISNKVHEVHIANLIEQPASWSDNWNANFEDRTFYGYGLSDADREELTAQIAAREREAEEARRAEEERAAREAQIAAEREARKIRYRVEGDHVVIKGTRLGISELEIPAEIEGKPVTKIEAYAFYNNDDLKSIKLPATIKLIERGAFMGLKKLKDYVRVPKDCIVGKDNDCVRR